MENQWLPWLEPWVTGPHQAHFANSVEKVLSCETQLECCTLPILGLVHCGICCALQPGTCQVFGLQAKALHHGLIDAQ